MNLPLRDRNSLPERVGTQVREALKRERWSARQAAFELGWTEMYMSRRLRGQIAFDVADLEKLARLLDIDPRSFFPDGVPVSRDPVNLGYSAAPLRTRRYARCAISIPHRPGDLALNVA